MRCLRQGYIVCSKDVFVGVGLFLMIMVIGLAHFLYAVPYAFTVSDAELQRTTGYGTVARIIAAVRVPVAVTTAVMFVATEGLLLALLFGDPGIVSEADAADHSERDEGEAHFCPVCGVFVLGFDHHCGIVGACIGRRTMPVFVTFIASAAVLLQAGEILVAPLTALAHYREALFVAPPSMPVLATVFVLGSCAYLGAYTTGLSLWYLHLAARGQFSLERRRRLTMAALSEANTGSARVRYDSTRRMHWADVTAMFGHWREYRLATE
jgi:hypothetical protein